VIENDATALAIRIATCSEKGYSLRLNRRSSGYRTQLLYVCSPRPVRGEGSGVRGADWVSLRDLLLLHLLITLLSSFTRSSLLVVIYKHFCQTLTAYTADATQAPNSKDLKLSC
jgi:hypothetical protein